VEADDGPLYWDFPSELEDSEPAEYYTRTLLCIYMYYTVETWGECHSSTDNQERLLVLIRLTGYLKAIERLPAMSSTTGVYRCTPGCAGLTHASTTREPRIDAVLYPQVDIICTSTTNHSGWFACTMTDLKTESHLYSRESCRSCFPRRRGGLRWSKRDQNCSPDFRGCLSSLTTTETFLLSAETANRFVGILREITLSEC
jgi:hypothetical protein